MINQEAYDEGTCSYRLGESVAQLIARSEAIEVRLPDDQYAVPSLVCGFFQGAIEDIRAIRNETQ